MGSKVGNILGALSPAYDLATGGKGGALKSAIGVLGGQALSGALGGGSILGTSAGSPLGGGLSGPTQGTGILGSISRNIPSLGSVGGGGISSFGDAGSLLSNVLSAGLGTSANDDAEKDLLKAQGKALGAIEPFANTSFTPDDLQNDPGYQFQLAQGEQALARNQAARGNYFSGSAAKAAQDYGQGLAATSFNEANNRFNTNRNFNYGVATDQAGIYGNQGNIQANAGVANNNVLSNSLSGIFGTTPYTNPGVAGGNTNLGRRIVSYDPQTGQPIYG